MFSSVLTALSLSAVAAAATAGPPACVAFDIHWNLLAFGFNGKDYNAGTQDTWTSGGAFPCFLCILYCVIEKWLTMGTVDAPTDITTSGRPYVVPFLFRTTTCANPGLLFLWLLRPFNSVNTTCYLSQVRVPSSSSAWTGWASLVPYLTNYIFPEMCSSQMRSTSSMLTLLIRLI